MTPIPGRDVQQLLESAVSHHRAGRLVQAKTLYKQSLEAAPGNPDALHLLGLLCFHEGDPGTAMRLIREAIERQPGFPPYHDNLAMVCMSAGSVETALEALREAEKLEGEQPHRSFNIGIACEQLDMTREAESAYRSALRQNPGESDFHFNLGNLLLAEGRPGEAADAFRAALKCDPKAEGALVNLANLCLESGRAGEACECYEALLRLRPDDAEITIALGRALLLDNRHGSAAPHFMTLLDREPDHSGARNGLVQALRHMDPGDYSPAIERHTLDMLTRGHVHPQALARIAANQLRHKYKLKGTAEDLESLVRESLPALRKDPLLSSVLTLAINTDPILEKAILALRKCLLMRMADTEQAGEDGLRLATALAEQALSNEYVCPAGAVEEEMVRRMVERLEQAVAAGKGIGGKTLVDVICIAMYRPLAALGCDSSLAAIPQADWNWQVRPFVTRAIHDPRREKALRDTIACFGDITSEVSGRVRAQYEENPYPRWRSLHVRRRDSYATELNKAFPHFDAPDFLDGPVAVLAAGCGTGQEASAIAGARPDCRVTGVDLSIASLAYAARMSKDLGIENIEFRQGDLMDIGRLSRQFQVIECTGVLHHLEEPESGWRALRECLPPGGVMKIGLYSELASKEVNSARKIIADRGIPASEEAMKAFRQQILDSNPDDPLYPLRFSEDLYSLSGCRDLLFHAQEQCFTLPRISQALEDLNLDFIGFDLPEPGIRQKYLEFNPADATLTDLQGWERFEVANPGTFASMYVFWCSRK